MLRDRKELMKEKENVKKGSPRSRERRNFI